MLLHRVNYWPTIKIPFICQIIHNNLQVDRILTDRQISQCTSETKQLNHKAECWGGTWDSYHSKCVVHSHLINISTLVILYGLAISSLPSSISYADFSFTPLVSLNSLLLCPFVKHCKACNVCFALGIWCCYVACCPVCNFPSTHL